MAANVGRVRSELGISSSIISDEELAAEKLEDEKEVALFMIDTVLGDADKLALLSQNLAHANVADTEAFLKSRRAGYEPPAVTPA
jgi:hypothetical protein